MAEIVAAKDFKRDKLWVEYDIRYDPAIWGVKPEPSEAGHLQGCTHVSTCTLYPGEPGRGILPHYVAHFSHPIEFEFFAQEDPKASQWPSMCFQVPRLPLSLPKPPKFPRVFVILQECITNISSFYIKYYSIHFL
jgi:Meckel syndrome type 1 protein